MTKYFATAYKTGSYPAITNDIVYVWARPHPKDANAPGLSWQAKELRIGTLRKGSLSQLHGIY